MPGRCAALAASSPIQLQIDRGHDDRADARRPSLMTGKVATSARHTAVPLDQIIAEREIVRMQARLKIRAVGNVQSDDRGSLAHFTRPSIADDGEHADPRHVAGEIAQDPIAVRLLERHFRVDARRHAEQSARRFDDLALRRDAAAREIDDLVAGDLGALERGRVPARARVRPSAARWPASAMTMSRARMLRIGLLRRFEAARCGEAAVEFA